VEYYKQLDSEAILITYLEAIDGLPDSYVFAPAGLRLDEGQDWSDLIDDLYFVDADLIDLIIESRLVSELSYKCDKSRNGIEVIVVHNGDDLLGFTAGLFLGSNREEIKVALRAAMQEEDSD